MAINERSSGIINILHKYNFHILGCGAIGSSVALQLCKMGATKFHLYDMDKVETINIGVSEYKINDVGKHKTQALADVLMATNPNVEYWDFTEKFFGINYQNNNDIVILGFDNMKTRLEAANDIAEGKYKVILVDGRMGAEHYQQYAFQKFEKKKYLNYWYPDDQASEEPCNKKATSYCSSMAGSFIANTVRKILSGHPYEEKIDFFFPNFYLEKKTVSNKLQSQTN